MEKINKRNKRIMMSAALLLMLSPLSSVGQSESVRSRLSAEDGMACGMPVAGASMHREGTLLRVALDLGLGGFELDGDRASVFTPVLLKGTDSLELPSVGLYSRNRWYQYLRAGERPLGGAGETAIRWSERPGALPYEQIVPYEEWMNGSELYLRRRDYACCRTLVDEGRAPLTGFLELRYEPVFRYVTPVAEAVKSRELSGRAYIDFPVDRTELYPEYRNNPVELRKIIATIDSVRLDKDVTVRSITIKGYASPESPYSHNTDLAKGRTATLKAYVQNMYRFEEGLIQTDYEPEDWAGLREYVETSNLEHRTEILALIDSDMEPDPKEWKIKTTYPEEYKFLLQTVYPGLRHSDYRIEYTIRGFSDLEEIRELMYSAPRKLSLNEMFLLAQSLEPGSEEYNNVFETAVRMYPGDATANLNAANAAMGRGDYVGAERYLGKAGDGAEAVYARGVLQALQGDYAGAEELVREAATKGLSDTEEILEQLAELKSYL